MECSLKKFHPYPLDLNGDENNESLFKYVPTIISSLYENSSKINNEIIIEKDPISQDDAKKADIIKEIETAKERISKYRRNLRKLEKILEELE